MKLINYDLDNDVIIGSEKLTMMIIENPSMYSKLIKQLYNSVEGKDSNFILLNDNDKEISIEKNVFLLDNVFNISEIVKKINKAFYNKMDHELKNEGVNESLMNIHAEVMGKINDILQAFDIEYFIGDFPTFSSLLKTYNIVPDIKDSGDTIETVINIIAQVSYLSMSKVIIIFNLLSFVVEEKIPYIVEYAANKDICLIDIERYDTEIAFNNVRKLILDKDFCEILVNYD